MGNTLIQDSTTGNIMGLRPGFIPIGMKEHGGILYIASYNIFTKEGELGTIPSPVFNYTYNQFPQYANFSDIKLTNYNTTNDEILYNKFVSDSFQISNVRLSVGDQFIVCLDINGITNTNLTQKTIKRNVIGATTTDISSICGTVGINYPIITGFKNRNEEYIPDYGMFKVVLESKMENCSTTVNLSNISDKAQVYYSEDSFEPHYSNYWFVDSKTIPDGFKLDTDRCELNKVYRTYPNILPGYLYVHLEPELPENFQFPVNDTTGVRSPNFFVIFTENLNYKEDTNFNPYQDQIKASIPVNRKDITTMIEDTSHENIKM